MIRSKQCPKCGDSRIAGPHNLWGGEGHIKIDLPGVYTATLVAYTCAICGYTEIYSDEGGLRNIRRDGRFIVSPSAPREAHCRRCGAPIRPGESMCYECGTPL
ncbi:MAG: hypothetical protein ACFE7R_09385 [Candidatus Hodarchaeota archaeon]